MKTGKESKPPGNIHRQQLFYWMGASIDRKNKGRKILSNDLVNECLAQIAGSLENGIWVKTPRIPEKLTFRGQSFALNSPIACFTEWSLGESLPHTTEYGRIGFGFPKRWVIERGGQSVTYFRHNEKGSFLQSIFRLLNVLGTEQEHGIWKASAEGNGFDDLRYLLHFAKMIRLRKAAREQRKTGAKPAPKPGRNKPRKAEPNEALFFKRKFGQPLEFVEEREWRIVHHPSSPHFVKGPGVPEFYLPYVPGDELFTLVLPDNKVVSELLQRDWFAERLFTPWKNALYPKLEKRRVPPVTVLAHSDIGTY